MSAVLGMTTFAAMPVSIDNGEEPWRVQFQVGCGPPGLAVVLPITDVGDGRFCLLSRDGRNAICTPSAADFDLVETADLPKHDREFVDMPAIWPAGEPTHALLLLLHVKRCAGPPGVLGSLDEAARRQAIVEFLRAARLTEKSPGLMQR